MTHLLICADVQPQIGTGHLRRMLTLAEALVQEGVQITIQTSLLGRKIASDMTVVVAPCTPADVAATLQENHFDGVILDNYHWQTQTESTLRTHVPFIVIVDDLADRPHDADLLLDQNAHHSACDYDDLLPDHCTRLVGGSYCLLAKPFQTAHMKPATSKSSVFVSLGGGDPNDDLVPIVSALIRHTDLHLNIATGSHIAQASALQTLADENKSRVELVFDSTRVATQMQSSQFAIAAGGTMTWERAALGLPSLCLIVADNQAESAAWLAERAIHATFDLRHDWDTVHFIDTVNAFAADPKRRQIYAQNSQKLIARDGAVRTARALLHSLRQTTSA